MDEYIYYLFEDAESGEQFFVEICKTENMTKKECFEKAVKVANELFDDPTYICEVSPEEAETSGCDIY